MKMNNINTTQVQSTNDASTVSKYSAVRKNYFKDDFIQEFVNKKKTRASLIHLGYYTRAVIISKLITDFIDFINVQKYFKFQIISCGSGFDTTYWKLLEAGLLNKSIFIEIDFSNVIQKKILLINQSAKLRSYMYEPSSKQGGINKINNNYYLLEADLSNLNLIEKLFSDIHINYGIPTLFLSECVITYMKESDSSNLIKWMAAKFKNPTFINYEQINPDDGFGQVMLNHFEKLQSSLFSVSKYPSCESHYFRYKNLGFKNSFSLSEWDALVWLTTQDERQRVLSLELFDEFEEFHMKCVHYVITVAENGTSLSWIDLFQVKIPSSILVSRMHVGADKLHCDVELFRHCSCKVKGSTFVFGGVNRQSRSLKIYKISYNNCLDLEEIKSSGHPNIELDMVYGSVAYFDINKMHFVCLYGGRTSPDKIWNNGSPVIFEYSNNEFLLKLIINEGNPVPRYRTQMVSLKLTESEAFCWVFGGRTADLNKPLSDFWQLRIKHDNKENLTYNWKQYEKKNENWPCSRMSHSFIGCPKRSELFIIGGFTVESSSPLNDMWKWCCRSELWEKVQLVGKLLPRYGHTAHLKDDKIYLVGGVNTLADSQPGLATIDLRSLTVVEYAVALPVPGPVLLFNHTSELVGCDDEAYICVFGGGGNCFSFGTYINPCAICIKLSYLNRSSEK